MSTSDAELIQIEGGYRVAETPTHYLDVMKMLFSWRLCETPKSCPLVYDRYWCYRGGDIQALLAAVAAARAWDGAQDTEPAGWNKNGQTQEWREPQPSVAVQGRLHGVHTRNADDRLTLASIYSCSMTVLDTARLDRWHPLRASRSGPHKR
jgi:hypothetical protein